MHDYKKMFFYMEGRKDTMCENSDHLLGIGLVGQFSYSTQSTK